MLFRIQLTNFVKIGTTSKCNIDQLSLHLRVTMEFIIVSEYISSQTQIKRSSSMCWTSCT